MRIVHWSVEAHLFGEKNVARTVRIDIFLGFSVAVRGLIWRDANDISIFLVKTLAIAADFTPDDAVNVGQHSRSP